MCGRFTQYRAPAEYLDALQSPLLFYGGLDLEPIRRYNVAPSTRVVLLRAGQEGIRFDAVRWGWRPHWAEGKLPHAINAKAETVASGRFFRSLWPHRALVPADGWFEWVKDPDEPKRKQPYYIRLRSGEPLFCAAIAQITPGLESRDDDGFVIITAAAQGGMVDIHDRRPVVLSPALAREWIDPDTGSERAAEIVRDLGVGADAFEWYPVSKAVGSPKNQGPELIAPLTE